MPATMVGMPMIAAQPANRFDTSFCEIETWATRTPAQ